ncbi:uncharacterized protein LOC135096096 isoform X2 [Scylla paramamosain]|uniref:uncharacterized protein LOC135096096 isoform X2 n=1 Tax=Scylla paramamosain TaxID=85552 RepID=UPI0030832D1D
MQEGLAVMTAGCHRPAGVMVPDQLVHISEMVVVLENSWFAKGSARQAARTHSHQKDHRSWEHRVLFGRKEARLLGHGLTPLSHTPTGMRGASQQATSPTQLPPAS